MKGNKERERGEVGRKLTRILLTQYGVPRPGSAMDPDGRARGIVQDLARALLGLPKKECVRGDDDPGNATPKYARMVKNMRAIL